MHQSRHSTSQHFTTSPRRPALTPQRLIASTPHRPTTRPGTQTKTLSLGVATFEDLQIVQRGPNYNLVFTVEPADVTPHILKTDTIIEVEYSAEFVMVASDKEEGDYFG